MTPTKTVRAIIVWKFKRGKSMTGLALRHGCTILHVEAIIRRALKETI